MTDNNNLDQHNEYFCCINLSGGYIWVSDRNEEVDSKIRYLLSDVMRDSTNNGRDGVYSATIINDRYLHAKSHFFANQSDDRGRRGIILLVGVLTNDKNIDRVLSPDVYLQKFGKIRQFILDEVISKDFIKIIISEILVNMNITRFSLTETSDITAKFKNENNQHISEYVKPEANTESFFNRLKKISGWIVFFAWTIAMICNVYFLEKINRNTSYLVSRKIVSDQGKNTQSKKPTNQSIK